MKTSWLTMPVVAMLCLPVHAARYALLVGNSDGGAGNQPLRYVANDLGRVRAVLVDACGFEPNRVATLQDRGPADVLAEIERLSGRLAAAGDDLVLFYYSGHADDDALRLGAERLPLTRLREALGRLPARIRVAVFDACQSGSFARLKGGRLAEPFLFTSDTKVEGYVVLASSSANESSQESDALRSSVFTFHVVNALRGSADATGDGRITLNEAYRYAYDRTVASTMHSPGGVQHPTYRFEIKGEGDIVLADLNVHSSGLLLEEAIEGHITILDTNRTVVADMTKQRGAPLLVALGAGTYEVLSRREGIVRRARSSVKKESVTRVGADALRRAPVTADGHSRAKGELARDTYVGFTIGTGYRSMPQSAFDGRIEQDYGGYSGLGLETRPRLANHLVNTVIGIEWWIGGRVMLGAELGHAGAGDQESELTTRTDPITDRPYTCELSWRTTMDIYSLSPGIAFRVSRGPLRNLALRLGLDIHHIDVVMSSTYHDELFDYVATRHIEESGALAVPSLTASYVVPIRQWFDIGILVRYRHQGAARELRSFSGPSYSTAIPETGTFVEHEDDPLKLDAGGIDIRLYLSLNAGKETR
ncbi:MAG: hypothetical protein GF331_11655 [Chitinivibrionales bacterium]|nr:hypothetical protein [Chitinivibrionales bacterium]